MVYRIPKKISANSKQAMKYLEENLVRDLEFSRNTYQVQMVDRKTNQKLWSFLQLDSVDGLQDFFCSCSEDEQDTACEHVAAAYFTIFRGHHRPLHRRFLDSFWVKLTQLALDHLGDDPSVFKKVREGLYTAGERVKITTKGKLVSNRFQELLVPAVDTADELPMKFANLSAEEMEGWRSGKKVSTELRYELSFWAEIAKWGIILEEFGSEPSIVFDSAEGVPNSISVTVKGLQLSFQIDMKEWHILLPTLIGRKMSLEVRHLQEEAIDSVRYDQSRRCFVVTSGKEVKVPGLEKGVELGEWTFLRDRGFYWDKEHPLLETGEIPQEQLPFALSEFGPLLRQHVKNEEIHARPQPLSTHLEFDLEGNLTISSYLFSPGDLSQKGAALFDDWVYLPGGGFYHIDSEGDHYHHEVIPRCEVSDYVTLNRGWFNLQSEFHTHLVEVEIYVTYSIGEDDSLSFSTRLETGEENQGAFDFGRWLYIEGQGFFTKRTPSLGSFLSKAAVVSKGEISTFIRKHHEDLLHVRDFFCSTHPVERVQLRLTLQGDNSVVVTPKYVTLPEFRGKLIKVFGNYVYLEGEGFSRVPSGQNCPEAYFSKRTISQKDLPDFFSEEVPKLQPFLKEVDKGLQPPQTMNIVVTELEVGSTGKGCVNVKMEFRSELGSVPLSDLINASSRKQRFLFCDAGLVDCEDQKFEWLTQLKGNEKGQEVDYISLTSLELLRLHALVGLEVAEGVESPQLDRLLGKRTIEKPRPTGLKSELRPYQDLGLQWLWYLYRNHLSGLLCDDMGLGKTHQAMALLAAIMNRRKKVLFLVVCPTSVIYHWEDKLALFLPTLRVRTYYGPKRSLEHDQQPYDLLLTSYGVIRRDSELLRKSTFEVAIFDEIQVAKNQTSRVHAALCGLKAKMFLGLTGTPMENRLRELKSLFDIVLPGYMPGESHYRDFFITPVEKLHNRERLELLVKFIKPFLLRRKKKDVLLELPDKTEDIAHCGLSTEQRRLYSEVLSRSGRGLISDLKDSGKKVSYVHVFALLSLLKQICNHPAIYEKNVTRYKEYESGKFSLFCELLDEARASHQKVVVFTQYLGMMDIIEAHLKEMGIGYASIRGATKDRRKEMERFQKEKECEVFVGSLQASGVGIDLTAASVVIHYDRWWNPAREDQATDRVHRIGQKRGVQVFKLVTKGTLEEQIDLIIRRKRDLLTRVLRADDENVLKQLDRKELIGLLQSVHQAEQ